MALVSCAECNKEVSSKAKSCPACGAKVPKSKTWIWVVLSLPIAFLTFGYFQSQTPDGQARIEARSAIKLCWDEQGKRSNTVGSARFIAGACEKMEQDFEAKFGTRP